MPMRLAAFGAAAAAALVAAVPAVAASPAPHPQQVGISFLRGDRVAEGNVALAAGIPVHLTVTNYTSEFHTFTVPALHVSVLVPPAHGGTPAHATATFTPHQWGVFAWHCLICPSGIHGRQHDMVGELYVIVSPSALP